MTHLKISLAAIACAGIAATASADKVAHFPMDVDNGKVTDKISGLAYPVEAATIAESVPGVTGNALRLDGYSNYVVSSLNLGELPAMTFSLWCAMETYPIIEHDVQNESEATCIAGNYNEETKTGFGFFITRTGKYSFRFFSQSWPGEVTAPEALPLYEWNHLVAVADGSNVSLYNNGALIGTAKCKALEGNGKFIIGKNPYGNKLDGFMLNTVNGIVDEVELYNEALDVATLNREVSAPPALTILGDGKYDGDIQRPRLHGMPLRNWTNETHGLLYYDNRYHLFFQKNANGPYMSRLQWGHLVSPDLINWEEMPIAVGSDKWYDLKGCWSGCVAVDDEVTGGKPGIIYTGVDYARAMICQASPEDEDLLFWTKLPNPIIDGKPSGLSDDFRDPYFFRAGDNAYIIVGSSKDGKGVCTLHKYNPASRTWSNDGDTFFQATNASTQGTFWEMPNVTFIDGKYLFTATPQGLGSGVKALYWVGDISADGKFSPSFAGAASIELPGFAKDGFGLLSPSVMQKDGKTIALGIVPDKLASEQNYRLGWAHTYSLPREWSLDENGRLLQKPYSGLTAMRLAGSEVSVEKTLAGVETLGYMNSRQVEVIGEFTVADADFGFSFFRQGNQEVVLAYSPASGKLSLDLRSLERISNDNSSFAGYYETELPETVAKGSVMKLQVFVDHSIMDIFVNDKWASSVRLFPTADSDIDFAVFSNGGSTEVKAKAWELSGNTTGIEETFPETSGRGDSSLVNVYSASGMLLRRNVIPAEATLNLPSGLYIVGTQKILLP